jgi:hypothetical protein
MTKNKAAHNGRLYFCGTGKKCRFLHYASQVRDAAVGMTAFGGCEAKTNPGVLRCAKRATLDDDVKQRQKKKRFAHCANNPPFAIQPQRMGHPFAATFK